MKLKCRLLGHKSWRDKPPSKPQHDRFVLISCDRCNYIYGVWVWFLQGWSFFKE